MEIEVDVAEAAKILKVGQRTIRKRFRAGKIPGRLVDWEKGGGNRGQKLMVTISQKAEGSGQKAGNTEQKAEGSGQKAGNIEQKAEGSGQKAGNIEQKAEGSGQEAETQKAESRQQKAGTALATIIDDTAAVAPSREDVARVALLSKNDNGTPRGERLERIRPDVEHVANLRATLIHYLEMDLAQNGRPKARIIQQFLSAYNSGILYPAIFAELGNISRSTLYGWMRAKNDGGVEALAPNYGGAGRSKITEDEKNTVLGLVLNQNQIKTDSAIRLSKYLLGKKGVESPSSAATLRRWVNDFRKNHYDLWMLLREGEKALNDKVLPYIERDRELLQVGEGLVADGHRLNFNVIDPFTGKPCRPALILFWDWRSGYPVGWEIMLEENVQCISSALRMAIITLGRAPKWVLIDNGKAFRAKVFTSEIDIEESGIYGMYARLGIQAHFATPYNAQAKPVERFFRTFTDWCERLQPSFCGASIEGKPAYMKRNEKLMRSLHNDWAPSIPETMDMLLKWREFYASEPSDGLSGKSPGEIFAGRERGTIDPSALHYLMMAMEPRKLHRNGVSWLGMNWYDDNLYGLKDKVVIRYSFSDLSRVYIFSQKNEFLCTARPVEKMHPMAEAPKDLAELKRGISRKRQLRKQTIKVTRLLGDVSSQALPWGKIVPQIPDVVGAIERMEAEMRPAALNPWPEETLIAPSPPPSPARGEGEDDSRSPLSGPWQAESWTRLEWYERQNPGNLNAADREWIEDYKKTGEYQRMFGSEESQRRMEFLRSTRQAEA